MRKIIFIGLLVSLFVLLAACGSATPAATTSSKPVNIAITTNPSPAMMGDMELVLTITDQNGQPIEGATVDVSVDPTDMSGMGMSGAATEQGGGKYSIKANFSESGNWKLTVYVRKDGLDYMKLSSFQFNSKAIDFGSLLKDSPSKRV
ncbi:MAG: FixH family protein [Anaerolineales bacterium]|nr:FixH family protein [Anaerolineales bacterium]